MSGFVAVQRNGLWGIVDQTGALVIPCEWESLEDLGNGQFKGTKSSIIDLND